jgi:hypothetical protein
MRFKAVFVAAIIGVTIIKRISQYEIYIEVDYAASSCTILRVIFCGCST